MNVRERFRRRPKVSRKIPSRSAAQQADAADRAPFVGSGLKPLAHLCLRGVTAVAGRVALFQLDRGNHRAALPLVGEGARSADLHGR